MSNELARRSPYLLDRQRSLLMLVDLQEKLLPTIEHRQRVLWNASRLLAGAHALGVPHLVTEQYPEKLGATVSLGEFAQPANTAISKRMFSCRECHSELAASRSTGRDQAVLCGIETHVCILQTALDLLSDGWQVVIVADAVSSRADLDHNTALNRLAAQGVIIATTESVLFEWCETSTATEFKTISALVRQTLPN